MGMMLDIRLEKLEYIPEEPKAFSAGLMSYATDDWIVLTVDDKLRSISRHSAYTRDMFKVWLDRKYLNFDWTLETAGEISNFIRNVKEHIPSADDVSILSSIFNARDIGSILTKAGAQVVKFGKNLQWEINLFEIGCKTDKSSISMSCPYSLYVEIINLLRATGKIK